MKHKSDSREEHATRVRRAMKGHKYAEGGNANNDPMTVSIPMEGDIAKNVRDRLRPVGVGSASEKKQ